MPITLKKYTKLTVVFIGIVRFIEIGLIAIDMGKKSISYQSKTSSNTLKSRKLNWHRPLFADIQLD